MILTSILLAASVSLTDPPPRLVTINELQEPLGEVLAKIKNDSGVVAIAADSLSDRAINICCRDQSAQGVLDAIASCLLLKLTPTKYGFRLDPDPILVNEEQEQLNQENQSARKAIGALLGSLGKYTYNTFSDVASEFTKLAAESADPSASEAERRTAGAALRDSPAPELCMVGSMLSEHADQAAETLSTGQELFFTSYGGGGTPPLDLRRIGPSRSGSVLSNPKCAAARVWFQADPPEIDVQLACDYGILPNALTSSGPVKHTLAIKDVVTPLIRRLQAWEGESDGDLSKIQRHPAKLPFPRSPYRAGWESLGEHEAFIAAGYGIPVISDAYRIAATTPEGIQPAALRAYIDYLRKDRREIRPSNARIGYARLHKGWLQIRHANYWRLDSGAVPERLLRPLESRYCAGEVLDLTDFAPLVSALSPDQLEAISHPNFLLKLAHQPFYAGVGVIQFLDSLSPAQQTALQGQGLSAQRLGAQQQSELLGLLRDDIFHGITAPKLMSACASGDFRGLDVRVTLQVSPAEKPFGFSDPEWSPRCGVSPWGVKSSSFYSLKVEINGQAAIAGCLLDAVKPFSTTQDESRDTVVVPGGTK